jgi:hypothetical protein
MDVTGTHAHLRRSDGLEFECHIADLTVLAAPPPPTGARVRYVGDGDSTGRPDGILTELWAVARNGHMAIVQPAARAAWFALLSDLEWTDFPHPMGPVADWPNPPFRRRLGRDL